MHLSPHKAARTVGRALAIFLPSDDLLATHIAKALQSPLSGMAAVAASPCPQQARIALVADLVTLRVTAFGDGPQRPSLRPQRNHFSNGGLLGIRHKLAVVLALEARSLCR